MLEKIVVYDFQPRLEETSQLDTVRNFIFFVKTKLPPPEGGGFDHD